MGPTFLGIGAQKCGTSWLYRNLAAHPGVWLPPEKELHYFNHGFRNQRGILARAFGRSAESTRWRRQVYRQLQEFRNDRPSCRRLRWYSRYFLGTPDPEWYRSLFAPAGDRISGDITPDYSVLDDPKIRRVKEVLGEDIHLIFLVRSPIERLWSHAKMEERLVGIDAPQATKRLLTRTRARQLTDYLATIDRWTEHFPRAQLFLGFMEDIALRPDGFLDALCRFLGILPQERYETAERVVHRGGHETLPVDTARSLAEALREELQALERDLGGHARWWLYAADELLSNPPQAETLTYPLWESELWERWLAMSSQSSLNSTLGSGPLSSALCDGP